MAIIYSKLSGEAHEVSHEMANALMLGEWPKGAEFYSLTPVTVMPTPSEPSPAKAESGAYPTYFFLGELT